MKICPNCGKETADEAKFCEECGYNFERVNSEAATAPGVGNMQQTAGPMPGQMVPAGVHPNPYQQFYNYNPADHTAEYDSRDIADNRLFAAVAYLFGLIGIITALLVNNSPFTRFHAKQASKFVIVKVIIIIPVIVPILGWFVTIVGMIALFVLRVIALVNVLSGKAIEAPIISDIGFLKG